MLEELIRLDQELFVDIHNARNGFLDFLMPVITNRWVWIPLYLFFAWWLSRKYRAKTIVILLAAGLMIFISDQGANLFKNNVKRPRPCHNTELLKEHTVITPNGCGGPFGFFSGHATNSFALAMFMFLLVLRTKIENWKPWLLLFFWGIMVCWSRIYLGVHYPGDVLCGALFGMLVGGLTYLALVKFYFRRHDA
ncbi:MAG TPA: phosphatase PAP2 family protein [Bacteroidia bacterium]|nr:phosphatase PAP2 family protein [Bacteroidia bacterium]